MNRYINELFTYVDYGLLAFEREVFDLFGVLNVWLFIVENQGFIAGS